METIVHLLRHGEVHNPEGVLYGRRDGFHLSELGNRMARRVAETIGDRDIVHLVTSPLERARETSAPLAAVRGLEPVVDPRVIESANKFEGISFRDGGMTFVKRPSLLRHMYNPLTPSWGEPYDAIAARMMAAVHDARDAARGPRGRGGLPPAADLDDPALRGGQVLPPPPQEATVHAVLAHVAALRRRPPGAGDLLRARRRHDPGVRPVRPVLGRRRRCGGPALIVRPPPSRRPGALVSLLACLLLGTAVLTGCTSLQGAGDKGYVTSDGQLELVAAADRGEPIELEGEDLDGEPLSLADFRGKVTVVNVWGAWCADCRIEQDDLTEAAEETADVAEFVGIDIRDASVGARPVATSARSRCPTRRSTRPTARPWCPSTAR